MIVKNGNVFCDDGIFREKDIRAENGIIVEIGDDLTHVGCEVVDAAGCYVIPGLIDIHTHGAMGADFSDGTSEAIEEIAKFQLSRGVTGFLGTTMALDKDRLSGICEITKPHVNKRYPARAVLYGIYLEGPFISEERRGAQNPAYIQKPDYRLFESLYKESGDAIRIATVAPEIEGGLEFIKEAASLCNVSLAHSTADYNAAHDAFVAGATHVTHLFNGMNPFGHREPGIIGAAFDSGAYVEIIADGIHIHPSVIRAVFKLFGEDRVCLISDSMRACGLTDGEYDLGGQMVTVVGRTATIESGSIAGSVTTLADCMRNCVEFGIPLTKAIKAATINPAKSAGIDAVAGSLTVGKRADILVLCKELQFRNVVFDGVKKQS